MRLFWARSKEKETKVPFQDFDDMQDPFDPEAGAEGEGAAEEADQPEAEEPTLDAFEGETRAQVERLLAREREQSRAALREAGLDLNSEGRPLIADAAKVSAWAAPVTAPRVAAEQPAATAQQAATASAEAEPEFDPLSATAEDFTRLARREAEKLLGPLRAENERLRSLYQHRAESEAMQQVRSAVERHIPEIAASLEHPDFETVYRQQLGQVSAEYLEDPATIASLAAMVRARLDPARMPAPRDAQGRFASAQQQEALARNAANRAGIAGTPPARGGGAARQAPDPQEEYGARFLDHFFHALPPGVNAPAGSARELWEDAQYSDIEQFKAARARREAAGNGRRR